MTTGLAAHRAEWTPTCPDPEPPKQVRPRRYMPPMQAAEWQEGRHEAGWTQERCPRCDKWSVWVPPDHGPEALPT